LLLFKPRRKHKAALTGGKPERWRELERVGVGREHAARMSNLSCMSLPSGQHCFLLAEPKTLNEPHVVRYRKYKPCMVHLRSRLAAFIRQRRGDMPQRAFARKMGVAQSTIMRIENEDQNVTLSTLEQLCKAFQVDIGDLFPAVGTIKHYPSPSKWRQPAASAIHEQKPADGTEKSDNKSGKSRKS